MTGRANPGRRAELIEQILNYLETHALSSISMRRLAQALGVSTFTLTYQFNNQEELMEAIGAAVSAKLMALGNALNRTPDSVFAYAEGYRKFWALAGAEKYSAYIRIEMESAMIQVFDPDAPNPCGRSREMWRRYSVEAMVSLGVAPASAALEAEVSQATLFGLLYAAISASGENSSEAFEYALSAHIDRVAELAQFNGGRRELSTALGKAGD